MTAVDYPFGAGFVSPNFRRHYDDLTAMQSLHSREMENYHRGKVRASQRLEEYKYGNKSGLYSLLNGMSLSHAREVIRKTPVEFMGWYSDFEELSRHGWRIAESVNERPDLECVTEFRFIIHHPRIGIYGTGTLDNGFVEQHTRMGDAHLHIVVAHQIEFVSHTKVPMQFQEVDIHSWEDEYDMRSWNPRQDKTLFASEEERGEKIFLEKASMSDILSLALNKQAPKQKELRRKIVRDRLYKPKAELLLVG